MAEASSELEGSDFEKGFNIDDVADGKMLLGHAFGEAVLVARRGDELFAIGATCTHYGGPLAKGLMVDCTVRCPWHHARFDLRTGEAIAAPALNNVACYKIDKRGQQFFVSGKIDEKPVRKPKLSPASVVIVGAGAAGGAAAEMLRREGYDGPVTLIGADEFLPYARWPDPRAGRIRVEHWVVAQRQGQTAARNILGAREPFIVPPFFWSNHFDLHVHYVGHGSGNDHAIVSGDLKEKGASVILRDGDKLTAVASVGRDLENVKAEVALERGQEFHSS